ncbi:MAG: hypothetical protein K2Q09_09145 [Phycisphaerales bacterium]|nr:hypothetical protein [Phycisphaerales bacterium]
MPDGDADKLAVLVQCDTEWHAEAIASALRGRGIAAQAEGGLVAGWRADVPAKSRVMVFTKDVLPARLLLGELRAEVGSIDWDAVDVGEHVEGVPEPAGKISGAAATPPAGEEPRARTVGLLVTLGLMGVAILLLVAVRGLS